MGEKSRVEWARQTSMRHGARRVEYIVTLIGANYFLIIASQD